MKTILQIRKRKGYEAWIFIGVWAMMATACSGPREIVAPAPNWVAERPEISGYYIGIASAPIALHGERTAEIAQRQALADLARQIRVQIESNSVLHTTQFQGIAGQNFSETIASSVAEDLEGYERVDTYESETEIWTYYRLNRATFERIRAERKTAAMMRAGGFFSSGISARKEGQVRQAMDRFVRSLEALKAYWGEFNPWTLSDGTETTLEQACLDGIGDLLGSIRIEGPDNPVQLHFQNRYTGDFSCVIMLDGAVAAQVPLSIRYSRGTLPRKLKLQTDDQGEVRCILEGFDPGLQQSEIQTVLDIAELIPDIADFPAEQLLGDLVEPQKTWRVELPPPTVAIQSQERQFGRNSRQHLLQDAMAEALNNQGIPWVEQTRDADLILSIESDTRQAGQGQGFFTAMLDASVILRTLDGTPILQQNLNGTKGVQLNWEAAGSKAYEKAQQELKGAFIRELLKALYQ